MRAMSAMYTIVTKHILTAFQVITPIAPIVDSAPIAHAVRVCACRAAAAFTFEAGKCSIGVSGGNRRLLTVLIPLS